MRETVGLSVSQLAELTEYEEESVRNWERGRIAVPLAVAEILIRLNEYMDHTASMVMGQFRHYLEQGDLVRGQVSLLVYRSNGDLWRYRSEFRPLPATLHASLVGRCCKALANLRIRARPVYMEPSAYELWLRGREDSELVRAEWATLQ